MLNKETCWYIYLIKTQDGVLYTGITTDISRRLAQHQQGKGAKFLRSKGQLTLVYQLAVDDRSMALRLEYRIKRLSKNLKERIVTEQPNFKQLIDFDQSLWLATENINKKVDK